MKQPRKLKGMFEIVFVIGIILLIPLFFAIRSQAGPQAAKATSTATPAPADVTIIPVEVTGTPPGKRPESAAPTQTAVPQNATPVAHGQQPPACTFPLAPITKVESLPETYTFSEPRVVLTAPQGNIYHIAEWLPDNQQVLMTEELRNVVIGNNNPLQESINLFNPETGDTKVYAIRDLTHEIPSWQPGLNAVVYPIMNYFDIDRKNSTYKFTRQVWISYGNPATAQLLADNLSQILLAVKPGGSETLYFSDKQISKRNASMQDVPSTPFDPTQWDYAKVRRDNSPVSYKMAWQPGTSLIFLYSNDYGGGGYTFILNADTGRVCELNLGGSATVAHWSSDGRYLAIGRATTLHPADLTLLDTVTGKITTLLGALQGVDGKLYINDFIWAPDNHHLLAIGSIITSQNSQTGNNAQGLYLVDIASGQSVYIAEYKSIVSSEDNNWAWSSDGSKLLMRCPTHVVDQICLISVHQTGQ